MNLDDLFSMSSSIEEVSTEPVKRKVDENLYSINLTDAMDGVYKSKIRFIPNFRNVKKSIISKYTYWLTDANEENGIFVDDPSSIGEKSPIGDMYWKLKKSSNPVEQNLSELLKRGRKFFSLVQIVEDKQHPELEGKILAFGYGIKIKEKIDSEFKDEDEGGNPFDLFHGRLFRLEVKKVGGFQNYDSCKFVGGATPIAIDGVKMTNSDSDKKKIVKYLQGSPELEEYDFKPWTAELTEQINERLSTYKKGVKMNLVETAISQEDEEDEPVKEVKKSFSENMNMSDDDDFSDKISSDDDDDFLAGIDL